MFKHGRCWTRCYNNIIYRSRLDQFKLGEGLQHWKNENDRFEKGHLSIGIWYVSLCYEERLRDIYGRFTDEYQEKCPLVSISYIREGVLPEEFGNWLLKTILGK